MIKLGWFRRYDKSPVIEATDGIVISVDTAQSESTRADYSVFMVMLIRGDEVAILDVVRERFDFTALCRKALELHRRYGELVTDYAMVVEHTASGLPLVQELRATHGIRATTVVPDGDKVTRMSRPLARIEAGAVVLPRAAAYLDALEAELMAFPDGNNDDQVDALSQGLNYVWTRKSRRITVHRLKRGWF